jgi:hypothetical protein
MAPREEDEEEDHCGHWMSKEKGKRKNRQIAHLWPRSLMADVEDEDAGANSTEPVVAKVVRYCPLCTLPFEYCEYGPSPEACLKASGSAGPAAAAQDTAGALAAAGSRRRKQRREKEEERREERWMDVEETAYKAATMTMSLSHWPC